MKEKINLIKNKLGFIAALDQSGGSSSVILKNYGICDEKCKNEIEKLNLMHEFRKRIITSKYFNSSKILGVILFEDTINRKICAKYTSLYLLENKNIFSFLKIDVGLSDYTNGVKLMKDIPNLEEKLSLALERKVVGTKMRSVIYEANEVGIKKVVDQQFELAKIIYSHGLIPIIEPEVDINSPEKELCEKLLEKEIMGKLESVNIKVIFKFTIPSINNFYERVINHPNTIKVVALSGGYSRDFACSKLYFNNNMIASFSRALYEGLNYDDEDDKFNQKLNESINIIYNASIKK